MNQVESPNPSGATPAVGRNQKDAKSKRAHETARILARNTIRGNTMAVLLDDEDEIGGERPSLIDPSLLRRVRPLL